MDAARRGTHTGDPHRGPTQRGPPQGTHTGDPHRNTQGTHTEGRAPQRTHNRRGGPHRGPTQNTHRQHAPSLSRSNSAVADATAPKPAWRGLLSPVVLAFTRYCFTSKLDCGSRASFCCHPQLQSLLWLQHYYTTIAQYTPPHRAPLLMPYPMRYWWWQYRVKANGGSAGMWLLPARVWLREGLWLSVAEDVCTFVFF